MSEGNEILKEKSAFLFDVLKRYDHYVATTNFKVGLIMSFLGVIIFGLTIRVMSIAPGSSGCNYIYYAAVVFSGLTIAFSLVSAVNLLRAVFPNTKTHDGKKSLIFFGDVAACENGADGYAKRIEAVTAEELIEDLSKQAS